MKGLFDPDGVFARAMDFLWRMIVLNVLFVICSIPVVTFGASSAVGRTMVSPSATGRTVVSPSTTGMAEVSPSGTSWEEAAATGVN